jgi:hypothetical protein
LIRFELALSTGQVLLRGEGRVVGFDARAHRDTPGLVVRFTRLDIRSKALIDKASKIAGAAAGRARVASWPPAFAPRHPRRGDRSTNPPRPPARLAGARSDRRLREAELSISAARAGSRDEKVDRAHSSQGSRPDAPTS